jgi:hypothetical protein
MIQEVAQTHRSVVGCRIADYFRCLRSSVFGLPSSVFGLRASVLRLRSSVFRLPTQFVEKECHWLYIGYMLIWKIY